VGLVGLAGLLPIVIFGLYGGAIADAVDRRRLYLWSSVGTWLVTLVLLLQTLADLRSVWLILGLVFVQSGLFAVASSARGAIIPRIVPAELVPAANTLNFKVGTFGGVVGPLIAGVVVSLRNGFAYAYVIDAALFPGRAIHRAAAAADTFGRLAGPTRAALGCRRTAVHRPTSGADHVVRRRHRGDGAGHATRAVPGSG
jgi:MFS family permease